MSMSEQQHTRGTATSNRQDVFIGGKHAADCETDEIPVFTEQCANAARFALAWNCHDEMLEQLRAVERALAAVHPKPQVGCPWCLMLPGIRAAIAKAEGKTETADAR